MDTLSRAKLDTVKGAAQALASAPEVEAVYLSGSLLADLGTPTSDVDLFAVLADGAEHPARQFLVRGERVDVEYVAIGTLEAALGRIAAFDFSRGRLSQALRFEPPLDLLVRFLIADIIKASPALLSLRDRIAAQTDHIRRVLLVRDAVQVTQGLEDFEGVCAQQDWDSAAWLGQQMLTHAGKSLAAAAGDLYVNRKWVYRQLARTMTADFPLERYRFFQQGAWAQTGQTPDPGALLAFLQECLAAAQLCGWDQPQVTSWPWRAGGSAMASGAPRRESYFNIMRTTEGVLLHLEKRRQLLVAPEDALVWALADGRRGSAEVCDAAVKLSAVVTGLEELGTGRAEAALASLTERRALLGTA